MRPSQTRNLILILLAVLLALTLGSSTIANFIIEYKWWREVGQVETWISMLWYSIAPAARLHPPLLRWPLGKAYPRSPNASAVFGIRPHD